MNKEGLVPRAVLVSLIATVLTTGACGRHSSEVPQRVEQTVAWRQLGSWSGRGSLQTESFTSDSGTLRIRWETTPQPRIGADETAPGTFRLDAHSAISGRLLQPVVVQAGAGRGVGYVQQDPHVFYVVVESSRLNWQFTIEEAVGYP